MIIFARVFVILVSLIATAYPQTKLSDLQSKFNALRNFRVNFVQVQNGKEVLKGVFYYRNDGSMRLEMSNYEMITDGKTVWNYSKKQNKVIISDFNEQDASMLSISKVINDYPTKCEVTETTLDGKSGIRLVPKDNSLNFSEAFIIPSGDGLVGTMKIQSGTSLFEVRLSGYQTNIDLSNNLFTFTPSERIRVIDLR
ncbi:MAG: outer membrane lipoprotein carrier protein LolA [Ignavibacteriaceae bacterium]|nr:outer membrane lipoprotein carrier protein LolA [Ignavibacteriaceae bacterium]